jgi:hypothetical protein
LAVAAATTGAGGSKWLLLSLIPAAGLMPPVMGWAIVSTACSFAALCYAAYTQDDVIPAWNGAMLGGAAVALAVGADATALVWLVWRAAAVAMIARVAGAVWLPVAVVSVMFPPLYWGKAPPDV